MQELTFYTLDVFTTEPFGGNPLAVIPEAPPLEDSLMQAVAREFNYPETVFVAPAHSADALYRLRIFTPTSELPFAGHPTIGTAQLLFEHGMTPAPIDGVSEFLLEEDIGLVPIAICATDEGRFFTWLTAPRLPAPGNTVPSRQRLAAMLGLELEQIGAAGMPESRVFSAGVPFTFIPLIDRDALKRCQLNIAHWHETLSQGEAPQVYVFCRDAENEFHARMFAPALGVSEDPATGAAAAAFAGYLWDTTGQAGCYSIAQGEDMGRPSLIHVELTAAGNELQKVRVGGTAVRISQGNMRVP